MKLMSIVTEILLDLLFANRKRYFTVDRVR